MSVHEFKCMHTQTAPPFNVPRGKQAQDNYKYKYCKSSTPISTLHMPEPGIEPGWLCGEAGGLTTIPPDLLSGGLITYMTGGTGVRLASKQR